MSIPTNTGIPDSFNSGDTVLFTESFADYPNDTWTATLYLNAWNNTAATSVSATNSGTLFLFTLSATVTAAIASGTYEYAIVVSSGSQKATPKQGVISVLPNFAAAQSLTFAQQQVALLQIAIAALNATTNSSVSFNGQAYSKANLSDYQRQLVYWEARVIFERDKINAQRGNPPNHLIGTRFSPPPGGGQLPWAWPNPNNL